MTVTGLYAGGASTLASSGQRSGIVKHAVSRVCVAHEGIVGDVQVDRRYHGGPEQAVHQFPLAHYPAIVARFPVLAGRAVPGSLGENLSCDDLDETTVCIGDVYAFGEVELEVSQPRRPCTKIDARYGEDGVARWLAERRSPGWYYRVRLTGEVALGDPVTLRARPYPDLSLARLLAVTAAAAPAVEELAPFADCPALGRDWRRRLQERIAHLRGRQGA